MHISDALVAELIQRSHRVGQEQLKLLLEQQKDERKPLQELVVKNNLLSEKELSQLYGAKIEVPFVELIPRSINKKALNLIPERVARQYNAVVFDELADGTKLLAMEDPDDVQAFNFLQKVLGPKIRTFIAAPSNISAVLDTYRSSLTPELTQVIATAPDTEPDEEVSEEEVAEDSPIAQTVNLVIEYAIKAGASDIHIEPMEDKVLIRYRVDGQLRVTNQLPKKTLPALVSRIKILSNLKIDERRAPQDGRFKVVVSGNQYALRVSTLPLVEGEKVVLRILNESTKASTLKELGVWGENLLRLERAVTAPFGMILFTGPTGSGKSTSLFSILSGLNQPTVNISTVEDPVEYKIPGVNQVQVNPVAGMTFANGLRALLRQDPNIIMVGEIRDKETANLAVQAALTGHLVFSTLHTNNAATTLPRLLDMGVEPFLIASTVRAVVGQRLVRKLVPENAETYKPDAEMLKHIVASFNLDKQDQMERLHQLEMIAMEAGIGMEVEQQPSTSHNSIERLWRAKSADSSGAFKGRVGIYEVLPVTSEIQKHIIAGSSAEIIQQAAIAEGMVTMQTDGFIKSLRGQTVIEEIMRVTSED